jgi:hypothetical protein
MFIVALVAVMAGYWDQGYLNTVVEQWGDNVVLEYSSVPDNQQCPQDFSRAYAKFSGQFTHTSGSGRTSGTSTTSGNQKGWSQVEPAKKMYNMGGQFLCYKRADDWDFYDISEWQAAMKKSGRSDSCSTGVLCGQGEFAYCVPSSTYQKNGNECPVTAVTTQAPAAGQVFDKNHVSWDAQQMLVLSREGKSFPVCVNNIGYSKPCWDEDGFYMKYRSDIDYSFQHVA